MLIELFDFAERYGIGRIVAASDIRFDRILKRAGLPTRHFGPAVRMENSLAVPGWAEIVAANRARIEQRLLGTPAAPRSQQRRDGEEVVSTVTTRWSPAL